MQADPLGAHLRDELGMNQQTRARPVQAALVSAASFAAGAALPLLALLLTSPAGRVAAVAASALGGCAGGPGRRLGDGGYRPDRAAGRRWRPVGHRGKEVS